MRRAHGLEVHFPRKKDGPPVDRVRTPGPRFPASSVNGVRFIGGELYHANADMSEESCRNAVKTAHHVVGATGDITLLVTGYKHSSADARAVTASSFC